MEQIGEKCECFTCDASYTGLCCGECYKCVLKGCRVCKHLDQCVAEHHWNEDAPKRIVERLEEEYKNVIDARDDAAEMLYKKQRVNWENENNYYGAKSDGINLAIEIVKEEME